MLVLVLPLSFAVAAFLATRALSGLRDAKPARAAWQQELMGKREETPEPTRRRRRESLRTKSMFERLIQAPPSIMKPADRMVSAAGLGDQMTGATFIGISVMPRRHRLRAGAALHQSRRLYAA